MHEHMKVLGGGHIEHKFKLVRSSLLYNPQTIHQSSPAISLDQSCKATMSIETGMYLATGPQGNVFDRFVIEDMSLAPKQVYFYPNNGGFARPVSPRYLSLPR